MKKIPSIFKPFYPQYVNELGAYPEHNPILITTDPQSLGFIRRLQGVCLGCLDASFHYDLSFCFLREVWVLYSSESHFQTALSLAQAIQGIGASHILILFFHL